MGNGRIYENSLIIQKYFRTPLKRHKKFLYPMKMLQNILVPPLFHSAPVPGIKNDRSLYFSTLVLVCYFVLMTRNEILQASSSILNFNVASCTTSTQHCKEDGGKILISKLIEFLSLFESQVHFAAAVNTYYTRVPRYSVKMKSIHCKADI